LREYKQQLEQTEKIIDKAEANGWQRQVEMNEKIAITLRNIITFLEGVTNN
jgi:integrase/recombinase XerD